MFDALVDWLTAVLGTDYQYSRGMWVDHAAIKNLFVCSVQATGGPAVDVEDRRPRFRVLLLGPENGRQHAQQVQADAEALIAATMDGAAPCGAANIRAMTEVIGPGYTAENRAWVQVDFQVLH